MTSSTQIAWLERYKIKGLGVASGSRQRIDDSWIREDRIGVGASSAVYRERNTKSKKLRAVKVIQRSYCRQDLASELVALTRLSKPSSDEYFVNFYGWFDDEFGVNVAMEYMELGDLRKHMNGPFTETETKDIAFHLLNGLQLMHEDGFTHRDLKPENIFVVTRSPTWHVKIGDFGVSKHIENDNTSLRTQVGTLPYMAPELLDLFPVERSRASYSNSVDCWAVGIILFELLCGERPFPSRTSLFQYYIGSGPFPEQRLKSHGVTLEGCELVRSLLSAKAAGRPTCNSILGSTWFLLENETSLTLDSSSVSPSNTGVSLANQPGRQLTQDPFWNGETSRGSRDMSELDHSKAGTMPTGGFSTAPWSDATLSNATLSKIEIRTTPEKKRDWIPMHLAAQNGDIAMVDHLRRLGVSIRVKDPDNHQQSAMHVAARHGQIEMISRLQAVGLYVDVTDNRGQTPVHAATQTGQLATVNHLQRLGVNIGTADGNGITPVHVAAQNNQIKTVDYLRLLGQNLEARDEKGQSAIHIAGANGFVAMAEYLRKQGQEIDDRDANGLTPLHAAAGMGHVAFIDYVVSLGSSIDVKGLKGETPMHIAARNGQITAMNRLRQLGQGIEVQDNLGWTPLYSAAGAGQIATIDRLRAWGVRTDVRSKLGYLPVHVAIDSGQVAMVDHFRKLGQDITQRIEKTGATPMHLAAQGGHLEMVKYLYESGQDPKALDKQKNTLMHLASRRGNIEMVDYLRQLGLDIKARNRAGRTPVFYAGHTALVAHFKKLSLEDKQRRKENTRSNNRLRTISGLFDRFKSV